MFGVHRRAFSHEEVKMEEKRISIIKNNWSISLSSLWMQLSSPDWFLSATSIAPSTRHHGLTQELLMNSNKWQPLDWLHEIHRVITSVLFNDVQDYNYKPAQHWPSLKIWILVSMTAKWWLPYLFSTYVLDLTVVFACLCLIFLWACANNTDCLIMLCQVFSRCH